MVAEISKYLEISNNIDVILKQSPYKTSYIIENLGMKEVTFFKKLREKRFTPVELFNISKIIYPNEYQKQQEIQAIKQGIEDIKNGNVYCYDEYKKEILEEIKANI